MTTRIPLILVLAVLLCAPVPGQEADDVILLGMSTAVSGPAADLGLNMRNGVLAAMDEINRAGGIHGRKLDLLVLDDGYEPSRTAPNMHTLTDDERVVAIIGNVGTPTAVVAVPIAQKMKTPFIGAFTGAQVLRKSPPDRYVINYRASYEEETAAMVDALVEFAGIKVTEIGFFTQRDAYGDAGFVGGSTALRQHGLPETASIPHGRYARNTGAVEQGLADLLEAETPVKAVIMVGAYAPCAAFIKLAREMGFDALFLNVSFVGTNALARALGPAGDGVIVTQVVPHPESDAPLVQEFRGALKKHDVSAALTFGALEGYTASGSRSVSTT